ncbi:hypothetical protein [Nonomuraea sp. NPDC003804]
MDENDAYIHLPSGPELLFGEITVWVAFLLPTVIWLTVVMLRRSK